MLALTKCFDYDPHCGLRTRAYARNVPEIMLFRVSGALKGEA